MFIGQYVHRLESKGRLSVPYKFRSQLATGAVLSQGLDGCLFLYPQETWLKMAASLQALPLTQMDARSFQRAMTYSAVQVDVDRLGRITIPDYLKVHAGITANCVVAGALDRIEIWDQLKFENYFNRISAQAESLAEKLQLS
jgi:MraZ protein